MITTKIMQHLVGKTYKEVIAHLRTEEDGGDCCGWSHCDVDDNLESLEDKNDAVLVDVVEIDYDSNFDSRCVVNFIFDLGEEQGLILGYDMSAGSGSGWTYGAYVTLYYDNEDVASANW